MENSGYFIIAGLGNPGRQYEGSRHNAGFEVIDRLIERYGSSGPVRFGRSMTGKTLIGGRKVLLVKPLTYMNRSGEALREIVQFYKVDPAQSLLVISDDIDLPLGSLRIRAKGSAGGHNGLKDIIQNLGTDQFCRIRVGVGAKPNAEYDLADYVLGHFSAQEKKVMEEAADKAAQAAACLLEQGPDAAMNLYNTRKTGKKKKRAESEKETGLEDPERAAGGIAGLQHNN